MCCHSSWLCDLKPTVDGFQNKAVIELVETDGACKPSFGAHGRSRLWRSWMAFQDHLAIRPVLDAILTDSQSFNVAKSNVDN